MRQGVQGWCTGMTLRDGIGREVGGGSRIRETCTPWLIYVSVWQKPLQYCRVISLQLKLKKKTKKESACNAGDMGLIPDSGRSPKGGNGNPLQYSCLENSMERGAWWATVHGVTEQDKD